MIDGMTERETAIWLLESFSNWFWASVPDWEIDEVETQERYFALQREITGYPSEYYNTSWQAVWDSRK